MKHSSAGYYLILFLAIAFWGLSYVFTKGLLDKILPIQLIFCRVLIAAIFLSTLCALFTRQSLRDIPKKDWLSLMALSFFEPFLYFICETFSLSYSDATVVSVIIATIPLFVLPLSVFYFKERLSTINVVGVIVSVGGIAVMLLPELSNANFSWLGIALAFAAVLSSIGYSYFLKKISHRYSPVFIVACQNSFGLLYLLPLLLFGLRAQNSRILFSTALATPQVVFNILMLAIFCSALAFVFYVLAMQKLGLAKSNTFTNLIPVVTAITAFFLLHEAFPTYKILGTIIVIAGICCVQHTNNSTNQPKAL